MKAVVVEIKNGKAAVLAPDGAINFIKNNNYSPGQYLDTDTAPLSVRTTKYIILTMIERIDINIYVNPPIPFLVTYCSAGSLV